jgi:hypothetical protein
VNKIVITAPREAVPDHECIGCTPPPEGYNDSDKENVPPNESASGRAPEPRPDTGEPLASKKHTLGNNRRKDM